MLNVSDAYKYAIKQRVRTDRLTGTITLADGTELPINDGTVQSGSVSLTEQIVSGDTMQIGTLLTNQLKISVYDDDFLGHSYANARVVVFYGLKLPSGEWEDVPLGRFTVDNTYTKRRGNIFMLTAFDDSTKFDTDITESYAGGTHSVVTHIVNICARCGVPLDNLYFSEYPNYDLPVSPSASSAIQTYRDMLEWCAALMGVSMRIDRYGRLTFVTLDERSLEGGGYDYHKIITGDERTGTEFFDLRALTKYISTSFGGEVYVHTKNNTLQDDSGRNAVIYVDENPLLSGMSYDEAKQIFINSVSRFSIVLRRAEFTFTGDPAIECFDTIGANGGNIDNHRTIAVFPTCQIWRFRGGHTLKCAFAELTDEPTYTAVSTFALAAEDDEKPPVPVNVKSKVTKRIDGIEHGGGSGGSGGGGVAIENAVVLQENGASTIIREFHEVEYLKGDKIGYAGTSSAVVINGIIAYPDIFHDAILRSGDYVLYDTAEFIQLTSATSKFTIKKEVLSARICNYQNTPTPVWTVRVPYISSSTTYEVINMNDCGLFFAYYWINSPSSSYPYGYVNMKVYLVGRKNTNTTAWVINTMPDVSFIGSVGDMNSQFANINEYNAAIGLLYAPTAN